MGFFYSQIPTFIYSLAYSFTGDVNKSDEFVENNINRNILYGAIAAIIIVLFLVVVYNKPHKN